MKDIETVLKMIASLQENVYEDVEKYGYDFEGKSQREHMVNRLGDYMAKLIDISDLIVKKQRQLIKTLYEDNE